MRPAPPSDGLWKTKNPPLGRAKYRFTLGCSNIPRIVRRHVPHHMPHLHPSIPADPWVPAYRRPAPPGKYRVSRVPWPHQKPTLIGIGTRHLVPNMSGGPPFLTRPIGVTVSGPHDRKARPTHNAPYSFVPIPLPGQSLPIVSGHDCFMSRGAMLPAHLKGRRTVLEPGSTCFCPV